MSTVRTMLNEGRANVVPIVPMPGIPSADVDHALRYLVGPSGAGGTTVSLKIFGQLTLTANATSTTTSIPGMLSTSFITWEPATLNAGEIKSFSYRPLAGRVDGSVTLNHPSNPSTDLTFDFMVTV